MHTKDSFSLKSLFLCLTAAVKSPHDVARFGQKKTELYNIFRLYTTIYRHSDIIYSRLHYGNMFRPSDGHHQANEERFLTYNKVDTKRDPISFTVKVKTVYLRWKHVAKM